MRPSSKPAPISTPLMAWIPSIAWPSRPSSRVCPLTCDPRPGSGSNTHTSKMPPSVSLSCPAALMAARMRSVASPSRARTGLSSTPSKSASDRSSRMGACSGPTCTTWLRTSMPYRRMRALATPPAATRAAVSRALARSRMLRRSSVSYFCMPARSAWPGRGSVIGSTSDAGSQMAMRSSDQFAKSRFITISATGLPSVRPCRMPAVTCTRSVSIFCRPPRP